MRSVKHAVMKRQRKFHFKGPSLERILRSVVISRLDREHECDLCRDARSDTAVVIP